MNSEAPAPSLAPAARRPLAHLPTPLESLASHGEPRGLDLWVKRDDLTGSALSGNKVRKLEYLVAEARAQGADTLITCGAVTSNHARATAVAAARVAMRSHLLLRGAEGVPDGNLLLDRFLGAGTTFIDPSDWPERSERMEAIARAMRDAGRTPFVIPEGGSNARGSLGYVRAATELLAQVEQGGRRLRRVVHATGSGGTTAGLALGFAAHGRDDIDVIGVAVCDDRAYFDDVVRGIHAQGVEHRHWPADVADRARWTIWEGHQGRGYAETTPEEMAFLADVARSTGLVFDPVYSGKAFRALMREAEAGRVPSGDGCTVFLHTGGIFGLFSFARQILALPAADDPGTAPRQD